MAEQAGNAGIARETTDPAAGIVWLAEPGRRNGSPLNRRIIARRCAPMPAGAAARPLAWLAPETRRDAFRHELIVRQSPSASAARATGPAGRIPCPLGPGRGLVEGWSLIWRKSKMFLRGICNNGPAG